MDATQYPKPPATRRQWLAGIAESGIGDTREGCLVTPNAARLLLRLDETMSERQHLMGVFEHAAIADLFEWAIDRLQLYVETNAPDPTKGGE